MFTVYYILNNRMDMVRCGEEQLPVIVETIMVQGGKIVKVSNEFGERIQIKFNCHKRRR